MPCLWDTDVLSEYHKGKNPHVCQRAVAYLSQYGQANLSAITRYEALRGLKAKKAHTKLAVLEAFCQRHTVLAITDPIIVLAADLWAALKQAGQLIEDNDLLIAATALHHRLAIATGNVAHFSRVPGLAVEDWFNP